MRKPSEKKIAEQQAKYVGRLAQLRSPGKHLAMITEIWYDDIADTYMCAYFWDDFSRRAYTPLRVFCNHVWFLDARNVGPDVTPRNH